MKILERKWMSLMKKQNLILSSFLLFLKNNDPKFEIFAVKFSE